jgi:hypothetical protein
MLPVSASPTLSYKSSLFSSSSLSVFFIHASSSSHFPEGQTNSLCQVPNFPHNWSSRCSHIVLELKNSFWVCTYLSLQEFFHSFHLYLLQPTYTFSFGLHNVQAMVDISTRSSPMLPLL